MRRYSLALLCMVLIAVSLMGCQRDTTAPEIISTSPAYGQSDVERSVDITISFTESMNKTSVEKSFSVTPEIEGSFTWSDNTVKFTPAQLLLAATEYTVSFASAVSDVAGNELAGFTVMFTTHTPVINAYTIQSYDWMPDSKDLVMAADIEGVYQIYMLSTDGKTQRKLNPSTEPQMDPHAAKDGKAIAYVGSRPAELLIYHLSEQRATSLALEDRKSTRLNSSHH